MAAHSNNFIRVRLHFDYAPPGAICSRMCWLLVDLNTCRVVSDLESVIRQKFEISRGSILSLFVEECYLPHTESIYVVRDNDCVRVKVDSVAQVTGHGTSPGSSKVNGRKRRRPEAGEENDEDRNTELENGFDLKKKKRKKHKEKKNGEQQVLSEEKKKKKKEHKEKKKRKEAEELAPAAPSKPTPAKKTPVEEQNKSTKKSPVTRLKNQNISSSDSSSSSEEDVPPKKTPTPKPPTKTPAAPSTPALSATKPPVSAEDRSKSIKKPPVTQLRIQNVSSSDSSSSSEEDVPPKKTPPPKPPMKTPSVPKKPPNSIPAKKAPPPSSSSSDSDSSSDDVVSSKKTPTTTALTSTAANGKLDASLQSTSCVQGLAAPPPESNSEDEIKLVIHRPVQQPGGGRGIGLSPWRGRGRGKPKRGRGGAFRGRGFESSSHGDDERPYSGDSQTNLSVFLQNGPEQTPPKRDYSTMPLLAAPPQVGQSIAFMLLELTESYTPEVSEYKEAKIVNFDPTTKQIELELLNTSHAPVEPGKFDLVYQNPDGSERVEYAVARSSRVTERWDALLQPRLIL